MTKENNTLSLILLLFFAVTVGVYMYAPDFMGFSPAGTIYVVASFAPVLAILYALRFYGIKEGYGRPLLYMLFAFLTLFIGELIWTYFESVGQDPFPSIADYFYILFYPLLITGLLKEFKLIKIDWSSGGFSQFLMAFVAFILIVFVSYFGVYFAYDVEASWLENVVGIAYGVGDLVLVFLALFVLKMAGEFKGGLLFYSWLAIFIGLFLTLIADIGFAIYYESYGAGSFAPNVILDLLWVASFLFFAYGFISLGNIVKRVQKRALK